MPASPLHVWVLSDNRPGHYNHSRGIVAALAGLRPIEQHWVNLDLRLGLARNPMRLLLNHLATPPPVGWLKLFYVMPALPQAPCDLVVSAGGRTSFANAWLARRMKARNIFAGSLRRLSPALFDVVLTLEPLRPAVPNNLVLDLPPSAVDVSQLRRDGLALRAEQGLDGQAVWTMMLGGDGAGYRYRDKDWRQLAQLLQRLGEEHGIRWLLVSSRRTGRAAERLIGEGMDSRYVAASCWYREGAADGVAACLGAADQVFVTEDSMTMLTEAIYSRRPVVSLRPAAVAPTSRYADMIGRFAAKGWICRYAIEELSTGRRTLGDSQCNVLETSPLSELSQQLAERLRL
jgi:hypothetical protein